MDINGNPFRMMGYKKQKQTNKQTNKENIFFFLNWGCNDAVFEIEIYNISV